MKKNKISYKTKFRKVARASLEEIVNQKLRTNRDGKTLLRQLLIALFITFLFTIVCNLRIVPFFCEFKTILSVAALTLLIVISRNWSKTRKLFNDFVHPIVAIGLLVPSMAITLVLYPNEGVNTLIELLLLAWFTFFVVISVDFRNLSPRITIFQINNQENSEFRCLYSKVVKIYGDLFFGGFLLIFILAFLIAISGEDFAIGWLIVRARKRESSKGTG